jgi:hypothetical protein
MMRNISIQIAVVATTVVGSSFPVVAQLAAPDPLACFCLQNPQEAYFLWGCKDATPRNAITKQAICWNRQTQTYSDIPVKIEAPWIRIEDGDGSCMPCRPIREAAPDTPREGEECECSPAAPTSSPAATTTR